MAKKEVKKKNSDNKFGFTAFILGILSIVLFFTVFPSLILGILGIIFAVLQLRKGKNKLAIAGLVLSIIGLIVGIILVIQIVKIIALASLAVDCQQGNQDSCDLLFAKLGDKLPEDLKVCIQNPNAEGCDTLLTNAQT